MTTSTPAGHARVAADAPHGPAGGRTALVFSGQGNQWLGMGRDLMAREPSVRAVLETADDVLLGATGWSLLGELAASEGESRLADPAVLQPTLVALQIALAGLLAERGLVADHFVGHSLGEIAAAAAAGALDLPEALHLARLRGELMRKAVGTGRTALLGVDAERAEALIAVYGGGADVAAWNAPESTLVAGDAGTVEAIVAELTGREVFARTLPGDIAFHSRFLEPLRTEFTEAARGLLVPRPTSGRLVSTVTGTLLDGGTDSDYWAANLREPVRFVQAVDTLLELGCRTFVEIGPHPTLGPSLTDCCAHRGVTPLVLPTLRRGEGEQENVLRTLWELRRTGAVRAAAPAGGHRVRFLTAVTAETPPPALRGRQAQFAARAAAKALTALGAAVPGDGVATATVTWDSTDDLAPEAASVVAAPVAPGADTAAVYARTPGTGWLRLATARPGTGTVPTLPDPAELTARCTARRYVADTAVASAAQDADDVLVRLRPGTGTGRRAHLELAVRITAAVLGAHAPIELCDVTGYDDTVAGDRVHVARMADGTARTTVLDAAGRPLLHIARSAWRNRHTAADPVTAPAPAAAGTTEAAALDLDALRAADPATRLTLLTDWVREAAAAMLRTGVDRVPPLKPLNRLGVDSVIGLELRRRVAAVFGAEISVVRLLRGATPADLAADLDDWLTDTPDAGPGTAPARSAPGAVGPGPDLDDPADIERLLDDLDALSPEEVDSLLGRLADDAASEI
ncbi:acyltransferase domain-containing protein [Streptomyces sp. NPDC051452]|uniref:acyltransferase domain-containing protein n=1 Tax=Streptomyces sp. NPDC051452 TaxID=3365654 RepID=UPI0037AADD12